MNAWPPLFAVLRPYRGRLLLAGLTGFFTVAAGIGLLTASAWLLATAATQPSIADLAVAVVGVRFFGLARAVCRYLERLVSHDATFRILAALRVAFYRALEPRAPAAFVRARSGDLFARMVGDIEHLEHVFARLLAPPFVALLTGLLLAGLLAAGLPSAAAGALACYALAAAAVPAGVAVAGRRLGARIVAARADLQARWVEGVQGMADLLAFGRAAEHAAESDRRNRGLADAQTAMARLTALHEAAVTLLMSAAALAVLIPGIPAVRAGTLSGVSLAVMTLATLAAFEAAGPVARAFQFFEHSRASAERVAEMLGAPPAAAPLAPAAPAGPAAPALELEGVRFAYAPDEPPVLEDVSFAVRAGERVAIVGPSGAGKSTVAALARRFWTPQAGAVRVGGTDARAATDADLAQHVTVAPQQAWLFNDTVRGNLRLAAPEAGDDALRDAATRAGAADFVARLPQGWETPLGEQGLRLSGGERRRLTLARAFLQPAPVMIFDEPTADLDPESERRVLDAIWDLGGGDRAVIVITHRPVALERADRILVLARGRLVDHGAPAELRARAGLFQSLFVDCRDELDEMR